MNPPENTSGSRQSSPPGAQVRYEQDGRGGTIQYESPAACFDMWYEFADGTAVAIIGVPSLKNWEAHTKIPSASRMDVLQFIGDRVIQDKLHGAGYFDVDEGAIMTIYYGKIR